MARRGARGAAPWACATVDAREPYSRACSRGGASTSDVEEEKSVGTPGRRGRREEPGSLKGATRSRNGGQVEAASARGVHE
jgi:hypothetical protein